MLDENSVAVKQKDSSKTDSRASYYEAGHVVKSYLE